MATYAKQKFEKGAEEKIVYWRQDKHVHNANLISEIARRLGVTYGGTWTVRVNSYESGISKEPTGANVVELKDLDEWQGARAVRTAGRYGPRPPFP
jgi:hypothetical protein